MEVHVQSRLGSQYRYRGFARGAVLVLAWIVLASRPDVVRAGEGQTAAAVDNSPTRGALWASSTVEDHIRAGCPRTERPHARPSRTPAYGGYYVGGGASIRGEGRRVFDDGTWGWDYPGWVVPRIIALDWHHGRRYQGGQGAYRTDH